MIVQTTQTPLRLRVRLTVVVAARAGGAPGGVAFDIVGTTLQGGVFRALVGVAVDLPRGVKILTTGGGWRPVPIVGLSGLIDN